MIDAAATPQGPTDDNGPDEIPSWVWDPDRRRIAWANDAGVRFWGEASLGDLFDKAFPPESAAAQTFNALGLAAQRHGVLTERALLLVDGAPRPVRLSVAPTPLGDGRDGLQIAAYGLGPDAYRSEALRLAEIVAHLPAPVALYAADGGLIVQNAAADAALGRGARRISDRFDEAEGRRLIVSVLAAGAQSRVSGVATPFGRRPHRVTATRITDPATGAPAILALFKDVSERQLYDARAAAEAETAALGERVADPFRRLTDVIETGVALLKGERILYVNRAGARLLGFASAEAAAGETIAGGDPAREEDGARLTAALKAMGAAGLDRSETAIGSAALKLARLPAPDDGLVAATISPRGVRATARAGEAKPARPAPPPIPMVAPAPAGGDASEPEDEPSAGDMLAALDATGLGVCMVDASGAIRMFNAAAEAIFGLEREDALGRRLTDLFSAETAPRVAALIGDVAAPAADLRERRPRADFGGRPDEAIARDSRGGETPVHISVGRNGRRDGLVCVMLRDIGDWRRIESELVAARDEAERASALKSGFLAAVSHEIRTPLNSIIGFSDLALMHPPGECDPAKLQSHARNIREGAAHILSLVDDLLDLSRIEAGALDLSFEDVRPADIARSVVRMVAPIADRAELRIVERYDPTTPPVRAEPRSLRQILTNLIDNAVRHSPLSGEIIVTTRPDGDGGVLISVEDEGPELDAEEIERAFQPFVRIGDAHMGLARAAGLGLALARALTEELGGDITLQVRPEGGLAARVTLPRARR